MLQIVLTVAAVTILGLINSGDSHLCMQTPWKNGKSPMFLDSANKIDQLALKPCLPFNGRCAECVKVQDGRIHYQAGCMQLGYETNENDPSVTCSPKLGLDRCCGDRSCYPILQSIRETKSRCRAGVVQNFLSDRQMPLMPVREIYCNDDCAVAIVYHTNGYKTAITDCMSRCRKLVAKLRLQKSIAAVTRCHSCSVPEICADVLVHKGAAMQAMARILAAEAAAESDRRDTDEEPRPQGEPFLEEAAAAIRVVGMNFIDFISSLASNRK